MKKEENGGSCTITRFIICTSLKYHYVDQVKEDEVDGACGTR
jgi:hypothetical protein